MSVFPRGTRVTCALPNTKRIGTPGSRVWPRSPLRRDLESTGQGTHLSHLRTAQGPLPPGNIRDRLRSLPGWLAIDGFPDMWALATGLARSRTAIRLNQSPT